ncbi:hypothetical protein B7494_g6062 [Chlorociboria aeruginascens]|nr:hypothetical protein B7494_g6062 [Chlorociboria aeruginascens]
MLNFDEKPSPGANVLTVTRPSPARQGSNQSIDVMSTIEDVDSTLSLTPTPTRTTHDEKSLHHETSPLSPSYNPNPSRSSVEKQKSEYRQNNNVDTAYDTDLEACLTPQKTPCSGGSIALLKTKVGGPECTVWPGQKEMKKKKKAMRIQKRKVGVCGCMAGLDRQTRIWVKVLVALVVVGLAVGLGVGISKAVGGGFWKNEQNSNAPIKGS